MSKLSACLFWVALADLSTYLGGGGWLEVAVDGLEVSVDRTGLLVGSPGLSH